MTVVAGDNPANLMVVGNRGVGAREGEVLGEVAREVVKDAICNVIVVQTGTGERASSDQGAPDRDNPSPDPAPGPGG